MANKKADKCDDPLIPDLSVLCKVGSIIVHVEEFLSSDSHAHDLSAIKSLLADEDVRHWIKSMGPFLPLKRRA